MANVTNLNINGKSVPIDVDSERTLLSVLRDDLELTGAKYGCGEGECGACTVLLDGVAVRSCRRTVGSVGDKKIDTIESLEQNGKLHAVQKAFIDADAMQCGYCTCGMVMSAVALLRKTPKPSRDQIVRAMDGNVCRCCAYPRIIKAVELAAKDGVA
ncbi:MAG TPA: (2Fe-2S)-binding protein [Candidatus Binatia bacterium]|nr:(2Fe-2S)-binding protein [Candidatus Binatia bacterium]